MFSELVEMIDTVVVGEVYVDQFADSIVVPDVDVDDVSFVDVVVLEMGLACVLR